MKILGQIGNYTLIDRETPYKTIVCAYAYDRKTETWAQGAYFNTFESACKYALDRRMLTVSYSRLEEIATNALCYLRWDLDDNLLDEMEENYSLELTNEELEFFGLPTRN